MSDASASEAAAPPAELALVVVPSQTRQTFVADHVQAVGLPGWIELIALRMEVVAFGRMLGLPQGDDGGLTEVTFAGAVPVQQQLHDVAHMRVSLDAALQTATAIYQIAAQSGRDAESLLAGLQKSLRDAT